MVTTIANPIYDLAFKYLMEDERVVKILLSALLRKQVVEVSTRRNELINVEREPVSVFRLDYRAVTVDKDGRREHVLIELQKTDLPSDLLRFRQYLGTQYRAEENMVPYGGGNQQSPEGSRKHGLPMVAIYLLGHPVGRIEEPVLYVTPRAENYDGEPVTQGLPDPFVDSLTHSSIIVQIPLLHGRVRNHVERILNIFDQTRRDSHHSYLLNIDEADYSGDEDLRLIFHRLLTAGASREMRERMEMEDLMLRDYDERGVELLKQRKQLQENQKQLQESQKQLQESQKQLQENKKQLQENQKQLQENKKQLQEQGEQLRQTIRLLLEASVPADVIAGKLNISIDTVRQMAGD